jgi:outer membrane receptor protein involved in Fe transport
MQIQFPETGIRNKNNDITIRVPAAGGMQSARYRWRGLAGLLLSMVCVYLGAAAAAEPLNRSYTIAPQPVSTALKAFAAQSDMQLIFTEQHVGLAETSGVTGNYSPHEALAVILEGTDLEFEFTQNNVIIVRKAGSRATTGTAARSSAIREATRSPLQGDGGVNADNGPASGKGLLRVAQNEIDGSAQSVDKQAAAQPAQAMDIEEIVVTGTHIRGVSPDSSPYFSYDREAIRNTGLSTTEQFIKTLPQNFRGGSNENYVEVPNNSNAVWNAGFGSGVNLRGLGSSSSLVLINGRRLAPASEIGDFIDVSMIPLNAVDRVDVLSDGASSIYGGDAVAGVVNFVLRNNYDDAETHLQYGTVTQGDLEEYRAGQTIGNSWDSGNVMVTYDFYKRGNLGAEDRDFNFLDSLPQNFLPEQKRQSALATLAQDVSSNVTLFADLLWSERESNNVESRPGTPVRIFTADAETELRSAAAGAVISFGDNWSADVTGNYSNVITNTENVSLDTGTINLREVDSEQQSIEAKITGDLFSLPAGPVKLAAGAHYREDSFLNKDVDQGAIERTASRDVTAFFGELFIPLIGDSNARTGVKRLELNASGRYDDYSDFGSDANHKIGLLWAPLDALRLRATYSTSFAPPSLGLVGATDLSADAITNNLANLFFSFPVEVPSNDIGLFAFGTDTDGLEPEESTAWTYGLDFDESVGSGDLSFKATYFKIEYRGRIAKPVVPIHPFNILNLYLTNSPSLPPGMVVEDPSLEEVNALVARALEQQGFQNLFGLWDFSNPPPVKYIDTNRARTDVDGVDVTLAYGFDTDYGLINASLNASLLFSYETQAVQTTPVIDVVNTLFNPVETTIRGQLGWSGENLSASAFVNYMSDYVDNQNTPPNPISSWTTFDLTFRYVTGAAAESWFNGMEFGLNLINVFDKDPPAVTTIPAFRTLGYDPTNASPLGRFISFSVTKPW